MTDHTVVSNEDWLAARRELLQKEKEFTRQRDQITKERLALPWRKVDREYVFQTTDGNKTLAELFDGRSQLLVYHFMFGPDWNEGCKSCSFLADHYDRSIPHLNARDVSFVTASRAPLDKLLAFRERMGWSFEWVSSLGNDFNWDYHVSFTEEEQAGECFYNYGMTKFPSSEGPGISAFYKDDDGTVFHTYSAFARGLDMLIGAYNLLDMAPKGRDEDALPYPMEWVRHRDRYGDSDFVDPYVDALAAAKQD